MRFVRVNSIKFDHASIASLFVSNQRGRCGTRPACPKAIGTPLEFDCEPSLFGLYSKVWQDCRKHGRRFARRQLQLPCLAMLFAIAFMCAHATAEMFDDPFQRSWVSVDDAYLQGDCPFASEPCSWAALEVKAYRAFPVNKTSQPCQIIAIHDIQYIANRSGVKERSETSRVRPTNNPCHRAPDPSCMGRHSPIPQVIVVKCDVITNIDPVRTPFSSGIATKRVRTSPYHEWQTDGLTAVSADNAWFEGVDRTNPTLSPTVRLTNVIQLMRKDFGVAGTLQAIDEMGIDDRFAYEQMSATKELARDIEAAMLLASKVTGQAGSARKMDGLWNFLVSNSGSQFTGASGVTFSESYWNNALQAAWFNTSEVLDEALLNPRHKRAVAAFSSNLTRYIDADDRRLVNTIDVYQGDFGQIKLFMSDNMKYGATSASYICYASQFMGKAVLRDETIRFAKTGDSEGGAVIAELTLECRAPKAACGAWEQPPGV